MSDNVEMIIVVHGAYGDIAFRRTNNTEDPGLWIKGVPDGDGEINVTYAELADVLKPLGINKADLFPNG